jgi:hypothetical protein
MFGLVPRFPTATLATGTMILSFLSLVCGSRTRHGDARSVGGKAHALSWIPGPAEGGLKSWEEFFRFGLVGVVGFAVDASTLTRYARRRRMCVLGARGLLCRRCKRYVGAQPKLDLSWPKQRPRASMGTVSGREFVWRAP